MRIGAAVLAILISSALAAQAQAPAPPAASTLTAEIRIELPADRPPDVSVEPNDRLVFVELPRGADYPLDFQASSGGIVRSVDTSITEEGRIRLVLSLASGYLAQVRFDARGVVLVFESGSGSRSATVIDPDDRYLLGPDDKISITVHNHPEHSTTLRVDRAGVISAPLVGEVQAAGLSPRELSARLEEAIGRSYLVDPKISVGIEEYRSQWVMTTGELYQTGKLPLRGGTRLKEIISEAGGFKDFAGREIVISRKVVGGEGYETIRIDRRDFEFGITNPPLQHEDIVEVPRAAYCYVQGEVRNPSRVLIEPGTTLLKAITQVGGLTEWANLRQVRVLYRAGHEPPERIYNLRKIQTGEEEDPMLLGDEVVVVDRRFF